MPVNLQNSKIQSLPSLSAKGVSVDILRLDLVHPVISGNKWFKLQYYLQDAIHTGKTTIASFGGAYSNHIVATAFAAKEADLQSIGFIRGERGATLSPTLQNAIKYGMQLVFVERDLYRNKQLIIQQNSDSQFYWIMEGGYGKLGSKGAADILKLANTSLYTHILCAAGTGTMLSGLIRSSLPYQELIGISVLKNHTEMENDVRALLSEGENKKHFSIIHDFHFGGYAKHPRELIAFMEDTWSKEKLPTDIVYTAKLLFAAKQLIVAGHFRSGARVLLIHSGGLQGNASLPPNTIPFS
ncbi:MAG: pyridoxal-phosphate dependent enzyme [Sediminibacterium sp.]